MIYKVQLQTDLIDVDASYMTIEHGALLFWRSEEYKRIDNKPNDYVYNLLPPRLVTAFGEGYWQSVAEAKDKKERSNVSR